MSTRYRPATLAWEAIYTVDFTLEQVRRRATRLGQGLAERGLSCLVAYDTRFMGSLFAREAAAILQSQGVRTNIAAGPTPLPALHHALEQRRAETALYISAARRPYFYNGLLLLGEQLHGLSLEPAELGADLPAFPPPGELPADQLSDMRGPYLEALRSIVDLELVRRTSLTIFVDVMNGTTAGIFPALLSEGGQTRAIEINREPDPLFGRVPPAPAESSLTRLKKLVRESDSHLGLALAADGTALAVVDKQGEQLDPSETALLLAAYLARQQRQRGTVVIANPAPGTPLAGLPRLTAWEEATGLRAECLADPTARFAELSGTERSLLIGATASGEIIIGRYATYPDAVLAGLLCVELVARNSGNLRTLIDAQREQVLKL